MGDTEYTPQGSVPVLPLLTVVAALALCFFALMSEIQPELGTMAVISVVIFTLGAVLLARRSAESVWSFSSVCFLVMSIFHFGALPEFLFSDRASLSYVDRWIHSPSAVRAAWIAFIGALSFVAGALLVPKSPPISKDRSNVVARDSRRHAQALVGAGVTMIGVLAWLAFFYRSGLGLSANYDEYLRASSTGPLQLIYFALGLGFCWAAIEYRSRPSMVAAFFFLVFAFIGFPIGLRGEVLFPIAAAVAIVAMHRAMPRWWVLAIAAIVALSAAAVVSVTRQGSDEIPDLARLPLTGLSEMGRSLEVVDATIVWEAGGQSPYYGMTYVAPMSDAFTRYVLRQPVTDPSSNPNYMSTQVSADRGAIGGSIIAEAYNNFRLPGVVVILGFWGWLIAKTDALARRRSDFLPWAATLTFIFLLLVRNSFAQVPTVLLMAVVMLLAASMYRTVVISSASAWTRRQQKQW